MAVGSVAKKVNSRATTLYITPSSSDLQYNELQNKNLNPSHNVLVEPTTSAGVVLYTGSLNGTLSGTLLFTNDMISDTGGYQDIATINDDTKELPIETWKLKLVGADDSTSTWTCTGMLETFELVGEAEGALKYNIVIRIATFNPEDDITIS